MKCTTILNVQLSKLLHSSMLCCFAAQQNCNRDQVILHARLCRSRQWLRSCVDQVASHCEAQKKWNKVMYTAYMAVQVKTMAQELGIAFLTAGFDPKWAVKDVPIMPKNRYR